MKKSRVDKQYIGKETLSFVWFIMSNKLLLLYDKIFCVILNYRYLSQMYVLFIILLRLPLYRGIWHWFRTYSGQDNDMLDNRDIKLFSVNENNTED